jgi:hypothetical protein
MVSCLSVKEMGNNNKQLTIHWKRFYWSVKNTAKHLWFLCGLGSFKLQQKILYKAIQHFKNY